jgi:hypothetical protein
MPGLKTHDDLRSAVDSMFRIRAVESPPDEKTGLRKVWHRGALHAELISEIDLAGEVARHEFSLFDDVVVWEREKGFVTGRSVEEGSTRGAQNVSFDGAADTARLGRIATALQPYSGRDRIIQHFRELVLASQSGKRPMRSLGAVSGSLPAVPPLPGPPPPPSVLQKYALHVMVAGLLLVAIAIVLLALK